MNPNNLNLDSILQMLAAPTPTPAKKLQKYAFLVCALAVITLKVQQWFHLVLPPDVQNICNELISPTVTAFVLAQFSVDQSANANPASNDTCTQQPHR